MSIDDLNRIKELEWDLEECDDEDQRHYLISKIKRIKNENGEDILPHEIVDAAIKYKKLSDFIKNYSDDFVKELYPEK